MPIEGASVRRVILCVDDEPAILSALQRCFRNDPYVVLTASGAEEALKRLGEVPFVDLVLADERMPEMTGTEFLEEVQRRSPRTERALLTSFPSDTLIQKGIEAGTAIFLYKPWDEDKLRDIVSRLLLPLKHEPPNDDAPSPSPTGGNGG